MKRAPRIAFAAVAAAISLCVSSAVVSGVGGSCRPRDLTAQEKQAAEKVAAKLRPLLPPAPAGWKVDGADGTDIGSGSCRDHGKSVPQPVSIQVSRNFIRDGPAPVAAPATVAAPPSQAPDLELRARAKALEQRINDLKGRDAEAVAAYQAARRAGDSAAQKEASARSREIRAEMAAPTKALMQIREVERQQRNAASERSHETAVAQTAAMLKNRTRAHVAITANSGRALARASKVVTIPGVPFAITQPGATTNLLFGTGWVHHGHEAFRAWTAGVPLWRVQDVNVSIGGNDEVRQGLIDRLNVSFLNAVIER